MPKSMSKVDEYNVDRKTMGLGVAWKGVYGFGWMKPTSTVTNQVWLVGGCHCSAWPSLVREEEKKKKVVECMGTEQRKEKEIEIINSKEKWLAWN